MNGKLNRESNVKGDDSKLEKNGTWDADELSETLKLTVLQTYG